MLVPWSNLKNCLCHAVAKKIHRVCVKFSMLRILVVVVMRSFRVVSTFACFFALFTFLNFQLYFCFFFFYNFFFCNFFVLWSGSLNTLAGQCSKAKIQTTKKTVESTASTLYVSALLCGCVGEQRGAG